MHAFHVEAEPTRAHGFLSVPFKVLLALVAEDVVLARHVKDFSRFDRLQDVIHLVVLFGFREMCDISGVNDECRRRRQRIDPSTAVLSVPATSVLASLLKPMWLSLICTKLNAPGEPLAS